MKPSVLLAGAVLLPACVHAQAPAPSPAVLLAPEAQIASAVAPLPEEFRAGATVLGYRAANGPLVELRRGDGPYICLASDPAAERFHSACYHRALGPFMDRGRELRAAGVTGTEVDSVRYREVREGSLPVPQQPAGLYSLTGGTVDPQTGAVAGARPLYVIYVPFATAESTGLPTTPTRNAPWLMDPGTPKAHIMFVLDMAQDGS
jgi:hypothetical protein